MRYIILVIILIVMIIYQTSIVLFDVAPPRSHPPLKVGLLYSTTGYRASQEYPLIQANLMAIEELNKKGGLLGRTIVPIIKDTQSTWDIAQQEAKNLIVNDHVEVVFGWWMPDHPNVLKELFEHHNNLLITPFQNTGIIDSDNIIFLGTTANQQVPPTVNYCLEHIGKRFYLVGTDYPFSHVINTMIREQVAAKGGEIVGESYLPLASTQVDQAIQAIMKAEPDAIFNSLYENDNSVFFKELRRAGIKSNQIPNFSFSLTESSLKHMDNLDDFTGNYATWNYFETIDTPQNRQFVEKALKLPNITTVDNTIESAYVSIYIWAAAVQEAGTTRQGPISRALDNLRFEAPEGAIIMNIDGKYAWRYSRIGKIRPDGQFDIVWKSDDPIGPLPYQIYHSPSQWKGIMNRFDQDSKKNVNGE